MAEKLIIHNSQSPGDYIVMTAAIRDLQRAHPGMYDVMAKVPQPAIFDNNPYVTKFGEVGVKRVKGIYNVGPYSIHKSNNNRAHFMWGFIGALNEQLGTKIVLTDFRPDLHLTPQEMMEPPGGIKKPYWVFASGGKRDFTAKWWDPNWWQRVASALSGRFNMVQVGGNSHVHPRLVGVTDLVGRTSFRDLMRLIYHSEGVLCIVTCFMHIAAAFNKPCVVVAGGREPWWWEGYTKENRLYNMRLGIPNWEPPAVDNYVEHRYLHTLGQLSCCQTMGCWKSRVEGQGSVCQKVVRQNGILLPRCMQMITPEHLITSVNSYYEEGILSKTVPPSVVVQVPELSQEVTIAEVEKPRFIGLVNMPKSGCDLTYAQARLTDFYLSDKRLISHKDNEEVAAYSKQLSVASHMYDDKATILNEIAKTNDGLIVLVEAPYKLRPGWEELIPDEVRAGQACAGLVYKDKTDRTKFYLKDGLLVAHASLLRKSVFSTRANGLEFIDRTVKLMDVGELVCRH